MRSYRLLGYKVDQKLGLIRVRDVVTMKAHSELTEWRHVWRLLQAIRSTHGLDGRTGSPEPASFSHTVQGILGGGALKIQGIP